MANDKERLLSKIIINPSGCWIWQGAKLENGYGYFWFRNGNCNAHRASFIIHKGEIPQGAVIRHSCDIKACINPEHLSVGSQQDNMDDCKMRHRQANGERHGMAKLNQEQVIEIKKLYAEGVATKADLARKFAVSHKMIRNIINGKNWTHLGNDLA